MENKIITGISQKLFETFGLDYKIYTENVEQFLNPPCFYVELLQSSMQQIVSRRYRLENLFDIHFFTNENEPKNCVALFTQLQHERAKRNHTNRQNGNSANKE